MALFVAKFLESSISIDPDEKREEVFQAELSHCLLNRREYTSVSEKRKKFESCLFDMYIAKRDSRPNTLSPSVLNVFNECSDDLNTSISEIRAMLLKDELDRKKVEELNLKKREDLISKSNLVLRKSDLFFQNMKSVLIDLDAIKREFIRNEEFIRKGEYLESVATALKISNTLKFNSDLDDTEYVEYLIELNEVVKQIPGGRAKSVMRDRFKILKKSFVEKNISNLNEKSFFILKKFQHINNRFMVESLFLSAEIDKFKYHFERKGSALNLIDKPEWPLRRLLEIESEVSPRIAENIVLYLAHKARIHFKEFRWSLIDDPTDSDLFSLTLAAYINMGSNWKNDALAEYMWDFTHPDGSAKWSLMDAWIEHDKTHFERAIQDTGNMFAACKLDPSICNIAQTVTDVLIASNSRIACIRHHSQACSEFTRYCLDVQMRDVILHAFKVHVKTAPKLELALLRNSIKYMVSTMEEYDVGSIQIRRQFSDLSTQLD